jgi:hypothetical protein
MYTRTYGNLKSCSTKVSPELAFHYSGNGTEAIFIKGTTINVLGEKKSVELINDTHLM